MLSSGCDVHECHVLLPEGVRIGEHDTCSPGESGWSCFGQRCAPRVIRGRGPYNAPLLTCRFCPGCPDTPSNGFVLLYDVRSSVFLFNGGKTFWPVMMPLGGGRVIIILRTAVRDRGRRFAIIPVLSLCKRRNGSAPRVLLGNPNEVAPDSDARHMSSGGGMSSNVILDIGKRPERRKIHNHGKYLMTNVVRLIRNGKRYPKGTRGGLFYSAQENKVFVSTNATFLEYNYMADFKPISKVVLEELLADEISPTPTTVVERQRKETTAQDLTPPPPRRSGREIRLPIRYRENGEAQVAVTDGSDDDPLTFKMAMDDVDREKWQEAMKLEIESMYSNSVWKLVDLPEGIKPIGCKWIYKRKRGPNGKVETFKARLVAKGFTQKEGVDYEDTFSPVVMLKSIRILLSIVAYYDYEIWQMDVKTAFLNGHLEETIYMVQPEGFVVKDQEQKVCKLQRSIYGLKQASRSWNIIFNEAIKSYGFEQNLGEPCVYKQIGGDKVVFLVLYVDDILLIGNDVESLSKVKNWLASQFQMKDLGEASYIIGIQMTRDRKNRLLALSQAAYIDKVLVKFAMENSKKGNLPSRHGVHLSKEQCPKTPQDEEKMRRVPYASAVGSLMYAMLCTRPDICFAVGVVSRYQSNPGLDHWVAVKHILKYLRRTRNYMLVYSGRELIPIGYTDSDFQSDRDSRKSTSEAVFTLGGGAIIWRSVKQTCVADSTMEAEYVAACEAAKEAVWLREFLKELEVVPNMHEPIRLYCDNSGAVANAKEPRNHRKGKHIERKFHLVREIVSRGDVSVEKIASANNIADPFTKTLPARSFEQHLEGMGLRKCHI
ncbi:Retrovirus-related Pol polyprotein from transposon TNT 1-94 [Vitis vinifera]|uniref:Retrovirus-related Pol polyprotein from transposon TNT 1-94 n=2 Tax=Vitis vinifera TaxID=29760 RepID=A0A438BUR8_VITVI|nr:Retrovirus-related Pol polyprotein from transposon TNT 1-94 [Vitis vinifera]